MTENPRRSRRATALFASSVKEHFRSLTLVGLVVILPVLFIVVPSLVSPSIPHPVRLEHDFLPVVTVRPLVEVHGVLMATAVGSFIAGTSGLFIIQSSRKRDRRLLVAGFGPAEILLARFGLLAVTIAVLCLVTTATLAVFVFPLQPVAFFVAIGLASAIYGFLGMILGVVTSRLSGMYLVLFLPIIDVALLHDPMLLTRDLPWVASLTPAHSPIRLSMDAAFTTSFDAVGALAVSLGYAALTGTAAVIVYAERILDRV